MPAVKIIGGGTCRQREKIIVRQLRNLNLLWTLSFQVRNGGEESANRNMVNKTENMTGAIIQKQTSLLYVWCVHLVERRRRFQKPC